MTSRSSAQVTGAATASTIVVLPLLILELMNQDNAFPVALFVFLWVLAFAFALLADRVVRAGAGPGSWVHGRRLIAGAGLLLIAWLWMAIVIDQMPCFFGVPNCD